MLGMGKGNKEKEMVGGEKGKVGWERKEGKWQGERNGPKKKGPKIILILNN